MFRLLSLATLGVLLCLPLPFAFGQGGGLRASLGEGPRGLPGWWGGVERSGEATSLSPLSPKAAETYITIDGRAEIRVAPTHIRVVLAIKSEAETAEKCQEAIRAVIERLKTAWSKMGIGPEKVVADFIAVIPRHAWSMEKQNDVDVGVEKRIAYRMQTNLHLAVQKESEAEAALTRAFEQGVTDVIGFDYWSRELDDIKVKARGEALKAARSKADALLGALLGNMPPVINVQEQTTVHYPESLYHTVNKVDDETVEPFRSLRDIPLFRAYRPRHTYYRGLFSDGDIQPRELPMNPEISVVSTVRLYFKSPAASEAKKPDSPRQSP